VVAFLIAGLIAGIILGLRFSVVVLAPANLLAAAVTMWTGMVGGHSFEATTLLMWGTLVSLQIGYLATACILPAYFPMHIIRRSRPTVSPHR
jgi:hypothetical protein